MRLEDLEDNYEEGVKIAKKLVAVAKCTESLVRSWESMEAMNQGKNNYFIDFRPWISSCRNALNELDETIKDY